MKNFLIGWLVLGQVIALPPTAAQEKAAPPQQVIAKKPLIPIKKSRCMASTAEIRNEDTPYPGAKAIKNTTNLRRKTGIALTATGDRIFFTGKIVDSDCVPVQEALIEIWQADNTGLYTFATGNRKISRDENFTGTGRVLTDNEGNFSFLTIMPGFYDNRAPHINYRITHPDFEEITGEVFFEYHPRNAKDPILQQYQNAGDQAMIAQKVSLGTEEKFTDRNFRVQIPLKGRSTFRRF